MEGMGERIKALAKERGLKQNELADLSEVTESMISQIVNGKKEPGYETLLKLSEALGCSVDYLLRGSTEIPAARYPDGLSEYLEDLRNSPERKMLLETSRGMTEEQIRAVVQMIDGLRK